MERGYVVEGGASACRQQINAHTWMCSGKSSISCIQKKWLKKFYPFARAAQLVQERRDADVEKVDSAVDLRRVQRQPRTNPHTFWMVRWCLALELEVWWISVALYKLNTKGT